MWKNKGTCFPVTVTNLRHHSHHLKPFTLKPYCNNNSTKSQTLISPSTMKTLDESDVGISCYISKLPGFRGILKQRYSDFIVNEVDLDGNVCRLTCLDAPIENGEEIKEEKQQKVTHEPEIELFRSLAGDANADSLKELIEQVTSGAVDDALPIVLSPDTDKPHRTAVHNFIKEKFKFLVTDTVDGPDITSKCVRVRLNLGGSGKGRNSKKRKERGDKPFDSRGSDDWPEHLGKFLRFHLYKENKDTQEALGLIGKMLGVQQRSFGFSGTKDKRAVTTQRVTIFKKHAKKLAALNDRLIGIKVGDFCYVTEGLLLGQLQGNRFTITLRGVVADSEDTIKAAADSLGGNGFINYFGLQIKFLFILKIQRDIIREARECYKESRDIDETLRQLPRHLVAERAILQCLKKCPGNYLQALKAIPRTLRMMYVHSYQSYLWNHAASIRVQKYGIDQVVAGDLVYCKDVPPEILADAVDEFEDDICKEIEDCGVLAEVSEVALPEEKYNTLLNKLSAYQAVNAEDLLRGDYTIDDVILPLPGFRVLYPANDTAEVYHDLAKKDSISLTECAHNEKEFSITRMTGGYRRVFQKPINFEWKILKYEDTNIPLAETDFDMLTKSKHVKVTTEEEEEEIPLNYSASSSDAQLTALKLGLTLPASCYATMAIRELLKTSTSVVEAWEISHWFKC
ncbi:hypothetical protein GIB67_039593 [Kingdonia uniflora]|uniref:TRUD domain-containing protein n=1 Tax=Kingdonia uniflora TaxID=39325 RepID=A0A7J7P6H2_9MAGN|nr:hypothetical protein GIB67_039593 [Kingdonia uniflora]